MSKENLQIEFDRITNRGIIFGCVWIMGIGSVIAFISAYQANKLYRESGNILWDKNKIYKSLFAGIAGVLVWVISILVIVFFKKQ